MTPFLTAQASLWAIFGKKGSKNGVKKGPKTVPLFLQEWLKTGVISETPFGPDIREYDQFEAKMGQKVGQKVVKKGSKMTHFWTPKRVDFPLNRPH